MTRLPLSALLSQLLVAFTIECDNEFERRMLDSGHPGHLSLVVWSNLLRFVPKGGLAFGELAAKALVTRESLKHQLGCLERWKFVGLGPDGTPGPRDGWGSGRGIRSDWIVRPARKGASAISIWPGLPGLIEQRWENRFGRAPIENLRLSLAAVLDHLEFDLPHALPPGLPLEAIERYPPRPRHSAAKLPLATLLSQTLLAFAIEFDRASLATLAISANVLRVLDLDGVRVSDLPKLTGCSPETTAIGWRLKQSGFVIEAPDPAARRGKIVRLTERGRHAQLAYPRLAGQIEDRWAAPDLRERLEKIRTPVLAEGLILPAGVIRSGVEAPAVGRGEIGVAARRRTRDVIAQTRAFIADPLRTLPHYPLWDMNRRFGP